MAHRLPTTIQPGEFRHRVTIAGPDPATGGVDDIGGISTKPSSYVALRTCWASIETWSGSKSLMTNQQLSKVNQWICIRHPRTFMPTAGMLVWFQTRTFQINAVLNPTEQNKILVLEVEEINQSLSEVPSPEPS